MIEFFLMGGYAAYVWSSYAITCCVMIGLYLHTKRQEEKNLRWLIQHLDNREKNK